MNIGIVTSFYNGYDRFLPRWIESICRQSVKPDIVVMVASGAMQDEKNRETAEQALGKHKIPYKFIQLEIHKFMGQTRNEAVRNCETEWVMYLDVDDTMLPDALQNIRKHEDYADVICTGLRIIGARKNRTIIYSSASREKALAGGHVSCSHSPYRKSFWEKAPYIEINDYCDQALWLGFAQAGARFKGTAEVCTVYHTRRDGHNLSMTKADWEELWEQKRKFMEEGVPQKGSKLMSIKAHYYNPPKGKGQNNFGDMLVPIILKWLTNEPVKWVPAGETGKVLCIGSELASGPLKENDIVWGYGAKTQSKITIPENARILALRGPKTRQQLSEDIGEIPYGDPACLMPMIYQPKPTEPAAARYRMGVIPHYIDKQLFDIKDKTLLVIDVNQNIFQTIDQINSCDMIVSTSLHGAIVAEAYGKRVTWLKVSDNVGGMEFKWNDYITGTGREEAAPVTIMKDKIISKDLYPLKNQCLATPTNNAAGLIKAWRDYHDKVQ